MLKSLTVCITTNWKILREKGIPDHHTCILRNQDAGQKATVRNGHGQRTSSKLGVHQSCILSPCLFNLYAEYIMWNVRLDEAQAGIKTARRNINNLRYVGDTTLTAQREEELKKAPWWRSKRKVIKLSLNSLFRKLRSWHLVFTANRWGKNGNRDRSHEIKRCLLLWRKAVTNLERVLKSRHTTLLTKVHKVIAMIFPLGIWM